MKTIVIATLLCTAALVSCSKEESDIKSASDDTRAAIVPTAGLSMSATPSVRTALPGGPISGTDFPVSTESVFAVTAYKGTAAPANDYSTAYFNNQAVDSNEAGKLSFQNAQYYPADGDKLYFYAYSPVSTDGYTAGTTTTAPSVAWTIDGQKDIMWAKVDEGIGKVSVGTTQPQPKFTFSHLLKQVRFKLVKGTGFGDNIKASRISITNTNTTLSLNLIDGGKTFTNVQSLSIQPVGGCDILASDQAKPLADCILCEPGTTLNVEVEAQNIVYKTTVTLTSAQGGVTAGAAGVSHLVTLTFIGTQIQPVAEIVDWIDAGETSGDIK